MHLKTILTLLTLSAALCLNSLAHDTAGEMADAAKNFLATLDEEQLATAVFDLGDDERTNWHFIPRERNGLPLKRLRPDQLQMAVLLINSPLSHQGSRKVFTVMSLERVLHELENDNPRRDSSNYFISIFGEPGSEAWGWRIEGHHLSMNYTIADGKISSTPTFFGGNPGEVKEGPRKGLRVLAAEEDLGRALGKTLTAEQKKVAIILKNKAPKDILTRAAKKVDPLGPDGLAHSAMTEDQQAQLLTLIKEYIANHRSHLAEEDMKKITAAGIGKITFAWAGSMEPGKAHYYRVQGPTFLLEYDNVQNGANHPHAVWRDFDGDFGRDLLREHHEKAHE